MAIDESLKKLDKIFDQNIEITGTLTVGGSEIDFSSFLTSYTETDPTVPSHVKSITTTNISNWNTAYGWGNHADAGYLTALPSHTHDYLYSAPSQLSITDLNTISTSGVYFSNTNYSTNSNIPYANYFTLLNIVNGDRQSQLWFGDTPNKIYWRPKQGGTGWHPWEHILTSNNVSDYAITSSTIGSQSVNYATSSGYAANAGLLDGLDSSAFMRDDGWNTAPGQDANTQTGMRSDFSYANNAPHTGDLIRFGSSGYSLQLSSQYGGSGQGFSFRTRNGDTSTWNPWYQIIHAGNIGSQSVSYATNAGTLDGIDSSQFLRSDASDEMVGTLTVGTGSNSSWGKVKIATDTSAGWGTTNPLPYIGSNGSYGSLIMLHNPHIPWRTDNGRTGASGRSGIRCAYDASGSWWDIGLYGDAFEIYRNQSGLQMFHVDSSRNSYSWGSSRAPIFYDSDNTGYYTDPSGSSNVNNITAQNISARASSFYVPTSTLMIGSATNNTTAQATWESKGSYTGSIAMTSGGDWHWGGQGNTSFTWKRNVTYNGDYSASGTMIMKLDNDGGLIDRRYNQFVALRHSGSDFPNGTLVTTDIPASATNGASFVIEVTGKSYSSTPPFSFMAQGYLYNNTIINTSGVNNGDLRLTYIKVMELNGVLCFWWPRVSYWNSFEVRVKDAGGSSVNRAVGVSDSVDPAGATKKIQINLAKSTLYDSNTNVGDLYSTVYRDGNDTSFYLDPNGVSRLGFATFEGDGNSYNARTSTGVSIGRYAGSYAYIELGSTHASGGWIDFSKANGVDYAGRIRYWNSDERFVFDASGTASAYLSNAYFIHGSSVRAPIFYDENDTGYYLDPSSTSNAALRIRGGALHGPNPSWGKYLLVGGDGRNGYLDDTSTASVCTTNGNLHIDAASGYDLFLNFYDGSNVQFGNGSNSNVAKVNSSGHAHFPIYYDYNDTTYYINANEWSNLYKLYVGDTVIQHTRGGRIGFSASGNAPDGFPYARINEAWGVSLYTPDPRWAPNVSNASFLVGFYSGGTNHGIGNIKASGDIIAYASDKRLKRNIKPITNALNKVINMNGVYYDWDLELCNKFDFYPPEKTEAGVLAQEVQEVFPEVVQQAPFDYAADKDGNLISKSGENYLTVKYEKLVPLLIEAVKELSNKVEDLENQLKQKS